MKIYTSLHDRLKNQHRSIKFIIENLGETSLTKLPAPNKWSIKDNIAHLAKYQPIFLERLNSILINNNPIFGRYKAEDDPEFETYRQYSLSNLLDRLNEDRDKIFNIIRGLTEAELNRTGSHPKYGELTITQWIEFFLLHEAHHIFTIFQLVYNTE